MKLFIKLNIIAFLVIPAMVSADDWSSIEEETAIYGRIINTKNTRSVDTCKKLADKYEAAAFTVDSKKGRCSVLKSVRGSATEMEGFTSQRKVSN